MEKGWQVLYSVARCPECSRLIDLFANFTPKKLLAELWPHLLGKASDGTITPVAAKGHF